MSHIAFAHLYDGREIDAWTADLQARVGQAIHLPWMNASREATEVRILRQGACDLLPSDLDSFLSDDLRGRVGRYFVMGAALCRMVRHVVPAADAKALGEALIPGLDNLACAARP